MNNNTNGDKSKNIFESVLLKRIYLKYNQKNEVSKEKENQFVQSLIQSYIKKYIGTRIKLNRTWLCIRINHNHKKLFKYYQFILKALTKNISAFNK